MILADLPNSGPVCQPHAVTSLTFPIITGAALIDSINPCAIAVLLILIAALVTSANKKKVISTGMVFILGLFIAYFMFGFGLFSAMRFISYARIFHIIIGIFAILVGLWNIKNFFSPPAKTVCVGGICASNSTTARILSKVTSLPGAFIAGIIITIIELPCTGGPYIFAIGYLSSLSKVAILSYLIYYNIIFVLPLVVITLLIYFGFVSIEKTSKWKERNYRILNLITGLLMIGLGIWVLLS